MSHTGSVIHEDESPGMIRVVTTGYIVSKDGQLVFRKPKGSMGTKEGNQERFIIYVTDKKKQFHYGDAVCFSLEESDHWNFSEEEIKKLKKSLPKDVDSSEFDFKYVATEVSKIPDDFVMHSFYKFISDFTPTGVETILRSLSTIVNLDLQHPLKMQIKGEIRPVQKVVVENYQKFLEDYAGDDGNIKESFKEYLHDFGNVEAEINRKGNHVKSPEDDLPKLKGRYH